MKLMRTIKQIREEWKYLGSEEKSFFKYGALVVGLGLWIFWVATNVTPPVKDTPTIDTQVYAIPKKTTYELRESYNKYQQHCYEYNN